MKVVPLKIKMPFPIVDLGNVTYKHSKVTKISLPGYMLLVCISEGNRLGYHTIGECLAGAGIDSQMMDIFSDELYGLVKKHGMLSCSESFSRRDELMKKMATLPLSSMRMTDKGRKLFRDNYIDNEYYETKRQRVYYNPMERIFETKANVIDCEVFPDHAFEQEKSYTKQGDVVDFFNINRIKRDILNLEDQEMVTEVDWPIDMKIVFINKDISIDITPDGADFICEDGRYLEYMTDKFKTDWLDRIVALKYGEINVLKLQEVSLSNLGQFENLLIAREIASISSKGCRYLLGSNRLAIDSDSCRSLLSTEVGIEICRAVSPICDIVTVGNKGDISSYEPAIVEIRPNGIKGITFHLPSVIERKVDGEMKRAVMAKLEAAIKASSGNDDILDDIVWLYNLTEDKDIIINFVGNRLQRCSTLEDKSDVLMWTNSKINGVKDWEELFNDMAKSFIKEVAYGVTIENFKGRWETSRAVAKKLAMSPGMLVSRLIEGLPTDTKVEEVYMKLMELRFPEDRILSYANVIPVYVGKVISNHIDEIAGSHKLADDFRRMGNHLAELRSQTGIDDDPVNFIPKQIGNVGTFKLLAEYFIREENNIEKSYQSYAKDEFARLHQYYDAIVKINSNLEGKSVTESSKDDFILLADTNKEQCLANLQTRMEIELRNLLGLTADSKESANDMLNDAKNKRLINDTDFGRLNDMRTKRNDLIHSDKFTGSQSDLYDWIDSVFHLVEKNNAPRKEKREDSQEKQLAEPSKTRLSLPHKYTYISKIIQSNPRRALSCLMECEIDLLAHITSKNVTEDNVKVMLNNARTSGLMPVTECAQLVEMNRKYTELRFNTKTFVDKSDLLKWQKVIFDYNSTK